MVLTADFLKAGIFPPRASKPGSWTSYSDRFNLNPALELVYFRHEFRERKRSSAKFLGSHGISFFPCVTSLRPFPAVLRYHGYPRACRKGYLANSPQSLVSCEAARGFIKSASCVEAEFCWKSTLQYLLLASVWASDLSTAAFSVACLMAAPLGGFAKALLSKLNFIV